MASLGRARVGPGSCERPAPDMPLAHVPMARRARTKHLLHARPPTLVARVSPRVLRNSRAGHAVGPHDPLVKRARTNRLVRARPLSHQELRSQTVSCQAELDTDDERIVGWRAAEDDIIDVARLLVRGDAALREEVGSGGGAAGVDDAEAHDTLPPATRRRLG